MGNFLSGNTPVTSTTPKAFIVYFLLDDQFKYVAGGASPVYSSAYNLKDHHSELQNIPVTKNGYLYVYCSNESPVDVFFDNLQVVHTRGPILEETHYYPFGLTMAGLSSKAAGGLINRKKFNYGSELQNGEFSDGAGLEMYDTKYRGLDPQLGRWSQIDPNSEYNLSTSPYSYVLNNPLIYNDPFGLDTVKSTIVVPPNAIPGTEVNAPNSGGGTSSYIFDPNNPNSVNGLVGNGESKELSNVSVTGKRKTSNKNYSFPWQTIIGTGVSSGSYLVYNNKNWYSFSQQRFYSRSFFGNQYTAGGSKVAKSIGLKLTRIGYGLAIYNAYDINQKYRNHEIDDTQMAAEQTVNAISTIGIIGAAVGVGWELGKGISSIPWYKANIRPIIQEIIGVKGNENDQYFK